MKGELHSLSKSQLKVSQPEQSNSLEISPWVVHRTDVIIECVQMICRIDSGVQWVVLPVLKRFAEDGVEMLEVRGEACLDTSLLTFCRFCCAFSDRAVPGACQLCLTMKSPVSRQASERGTVRPKWLSPPHLTGNSWSLLWRWALKDQSQTLLPLLQTASSQLREHFTPHQLSYI